jgi:hypothetical protein
VILTDPAGSLSAENLTFSWDPATRGGAATNVRLELAGVMMEANSAESVPGQEQTFVFTNVYGTSCGGERTPLYSIRSPQVIFRPGRQGVIKKPTLYLFGRRIATFPTQSFNLDPRIRGVPLPGIAIGTDKVGILWNPSFLLDKNTAATVNIRSFKGEILLATAYATRSFLKEQDIRNLVTPRSDLSERFATSYFNSVRVETPLEGANTLRGRRANLSIGSEWNRKSTNDTSASRYSKFLEVVYDKGGPMGADLGYQVSVRAQSIRRDDDAFNTRLVAQGAIGNGPYALAKDLFMLARVDGASYLGKTSFAWARAEVGIYYHPKSWLTLGVGYANGSEFGDATYQADRLLVREQGTARLDLDFGPTKFSLMQKRDLDRGKWYREYSATQIMGCLEASVISREFPGTYKIGIGLRVDDFINILKSRKVQLGGAQAPGKVQPAPMNHALQP